MKLNDNFESRIIKLNVDNQEVYILRDFFDDETHLRLLHEAWKKKDDDDWVKMDHPSQVLRKTLRNENSETILELNDYLNETSTIKRLENTFGKILKAEAALWWDQEGYILPLHTDNPILRKTIQIYIGLDTYPCLGTSIGGRDEKVLFTLPFLGNSGYFFPNASDIQHGLETAVPSNVERYSVYLYLH